MNALSIVIAVAAGLLAYRLAHFSFSLKVANKPFQCPLYFLDRTKRVAYYYVPLVVLTGVAVMLSANWVRRGIVLLMVICAHLTGRVHARYRAIADMTAFLLQREAMDPAAAHAEATKSVDVLARASTARLFR